MTAFLKIDGCKACHRSLPWEWVPAVPLNGKTLAGTGVWRSQLTEGICSTCRAALAAQRDKARRDIARRKEFVQLLGGEKPYREFAFEKYEVTPGNRLAFERCKHFSPATENLYLWGPCGVGKTHLAWAIARHALEDALSVAILRASQLSRKVRMKPPEQEQAAVDEWVYADVLVLDDLGGGYETVFGRQILQEVLDSRDFKDRGGLVVTSQYSLGSLVEKMNDDTISSRVAGMCSVVEVRGSDQRLIRRKAANRDSRA